MVVGKSVYDIYILDIHVWKLRIFGIQDFSGGFQIAAKRIGMLESFRAGGQ